MNSTFEFDNENKKTWKKVGRNKEKPLWNNPGLADVLFPFLLVGSLCKYNSDNLQI